MELPLTFQQKLIVYQGQFHVISGLSMERSVGARPRGPSGRHRSSSWSSAAPSLSPRAAASRAGVSSRAARIRRASGRLCRCVSAVAAPVVRIVVRIVVRVDCCLRIVVRIAHPPRCRGVRRITFLVLIWQLICNRSTTGSVPRPKQRTGWCVTFNRL